MSRVRELFVALVAGLIFGLGLVYSGMVYPDKVRGFLDVTGMWDPSLALVMGGAVLVALPVFQWRRRSGAAVDVARPVDRPLVVGSLLFGVGWGLSGYCPGPALVAAGSGSMPALWYAVAMVAGIFVGARVGGGNDRVELEGAGETCE